MDHTMRKSRVRGATIAIALAALGLLLALAHPMPAMAAPPDPSGTFEPAPCMFDLPTEWVEGVDVECGYLVVPEQHDYPDGPTIRLAVAVVKSHAPDPAPDPLVVLQGGPGGSTIDTYTSMISFNERLPANRDIVLFDQRGTLYSEPSLVCDELMDLTIETIEQVLDPGELTRLEIEALDACHTRLLQEDISLSDYDSLENSADIEALRVALGYDQINLYGVSYGTLLALHTMNHYPQGLRSVMLDAVAPPHVNFLEEAPQSEDRAFRQLFAACAADPACNKAYPDLEQVFFDLVERLNETPARVPMTDPETQITYQSVMDGDSLRGALFQLLYITDFIPVLPRVIYDAREGDFHVMSFVLSQLVFDRTMSYGMYFSVICAEDADFRPQDMDLLGLYPEVAESGLNDAEELREICDLWDVEPLDSLADDPVVSDIPTLVFSGQFDPITPPSFGQAAAETLSRSYVYTFPAGGHGNAFGDECADQVLQDFLQDPTEEPDAACIASGTGVDFLVPSDVYSLPLLNRVFSGLESEGPRILTELGFFAGCVLLLFSVAFVWPLVWLLLLLFKVPRAPRPLLAQLSPWLALLNGVLMLACVGGIVFVVVRLTLDNDPSVFYGVAATPLTTMLLLLPFVSIVLTLQMLFTSVQAWRAGFWSIWRRLYYHGLTLVAFGAMAMLVYWGFVGAVWR